MHVAEGWAETAARKKLIPEGSHIAGEEWISGPYAVMSGLNGYMQMICQLDREKFLDHLHARETVTGQTAVQVLPHSIWESVLLSGIKGEIWMRKGVNKSPDIFRLGARCRSASLFRSASWRACYTKEASALVMRLRHRLCLTLAPKIRKRCIETYCYRTSTSGTLQDRIISVVVDPITRLRIRLWP